MPFRATSGRALLITFAIVCVLAGSLVVVLRNPPGKVSKSLDPPAVPTASSSAPYAAARPDPADALLGGVSRPPVGHAEDLVRKGFPIISNPRSEAFGQVANKSLPDLAAGMGDIAHRELTRQGDVLAGMGQWAATMPNSLYVLRLIEEGRREPDQVAKILSRQIDVELDQLDAFLKQYSRDDIAKSGRGSADTHPAEEAYHEKYHRYQKRSLELSRMVRVITYAFYVAININKDDNPEQLRRWIAVDRREGWGSFDMDIWLVDRYVQHGSLRDTRVAARWRERLADRVVSTDQMIKKSVWNALWSIDDPLVLAKHIDTGDVRVIDVAQVPVALPVRGQFKEGDALLLLDVFLNAMKEQKIHN